MALIDEAFEVDREEEVADEDDTDRDLVAVVVLTVEALD